MKTNAEVLKYKYLVDRIVGSFLKKLPSNVCKDDLMSAGMLGLWEGLCKEGEHSNLEAYLNFRIRGHVIDELRAQDWLPRRLREKMEADGETPMTVVRTYDMSIEEFQRVLKAPERDEDMAREYQLLLNVLDRLPERERDIIKAHYVDGVPFADIASKLGVTPARVSQLHTKAISRLKELAA